MTTDTFPFGQQIAWQPNLDWMAASNLQTFMDRHAIADYDALLTRSTRDIAWFRDAVLADSWTSNSPRPTPRSLI